jgi:glyoxylase-like metal-dependent hydrolase (beta-lactamase superfamily II)
MAEELVEGVWMLDLGWRKPLGSNGYVVDDGTVTLVDTGLPFNDTAVRSELAAAGLTPDDIDRVLVTHYDLDHVGGLRGLAPDLDAPVYVGAPDLALMEGSLGPTWLHPKGVFHRGARRILPLPSELDLRSVEDGDEIGDFTAHHTPGHNPGHMAYEHESLGATLLGDLVWGTGTGLTEPIWWDSYDMTTLRGSIRSLSSTLPGFDMALMGHGDPLVTGGGDALSRLAATV